MLLSLGFLKRCSGAERIMQTSCVRYWQSLVVLPDLILVEVAVICQGNTLLACQHASGGAQRQLEGSAGLSVCMHEWRTLLTRCSFLTGAWPQGSGGCAGVTRHVFPCYCSESDVILASQARAAAVKQQTTEESVTGLQGNDAHCRRSLQGA